MLRDPSGLCSVVRGSGAPQPEMLGTRAVLTHFHKHSISFAPVGSRPIARLARAVAASEPRRGT